MRNERSGEINGCGACRICSPIIAIAPIIRGFDVVLRRRRYIIVSIEERVERNVIIADDIKDNISKFDCIVMFSLLFASDLLSK